MPRAPSLLPLLLALSACTAAPPPAAAPPPSPLIAPAAVTETLVLGARTPDADFRYSPPHPEPSLPFALPAVSSIAVPDGPRGALTERHEISTVNVVLAIRRRDLRPAAELLLCHALLQIAPPAGRSLSEEIQTLGGDIDGWGCDADAVRVRFDLLASQLEPMLLALAGTLRDGTLSAASFSSVRDERASDIEKESSRGRLWRLVENQLYPAQDRYFRAFYPLPAEIRKLTLADLEEARKALRASDITVSVAGDLTPPALRGALERFASAWPATSTSAPLPLPPRAPPPPVKARAAAPAPSRGVFFLDDPAAQDIELAAVLPLPPLSSPASAAVLAAHSLLQDRWTDRTQEGDTPRWTKGEVQIDRRAHADTLTILARVPPGGLAITLQTLEAELARLGSEALPEVEMLQMRTSLADWLERQCSGGAAIARRLGYRELIGVERADDERLYQGILGLRADAITAYARAQLVPEQLLIVAVGPLAAEKAAVEALGLGKVTALAAPPPAKKGAK